MDRTIFALLVFHFEDSLRSGPNPCVSQGQRANPERTDQSGFHVKGPTETKRPRPHSKWSQVPSCTSPHHTQDRSGSWTPRQTPTGPIGGYIFMDTLFGFDWMVYFHMSNSPTNILPSCTARLRVTSYELLNLFTCGVD